MAAPIFSRRHYRVVAGLVHEADYLDTETHGRLVSNLVALFARDNARFSPSRFRDACEPVRCVDPVHGEGRRAA